MMEEMMWLGRKAANGISIFEGIIKWKKES